MSLIFKINLFLSIKNSDLNNFADDKTISSVSNISNVSNTETSGTPDTKTLKALLVLFF